MKNYIFTILGLLIIGCNCEKPTEKVENIDFLNNLKNNSIIDTLSVNLLSNLVKDSLNKFDNIQPRIIPIKSNQADLLELMDELIEAKILLISDNKIKFDKKKFKKIDDSTKVQIIKTLTPYLNNPEYGVLVDFGIDKKDSDKFFNPSVRMILVKKSKNKPYWLGVTELFNDGFDSTKKAYLKKAYGQLYKQKIYEFDTLKNFAGNLFNVDSTVTWFTNTKGNIYIHQVFDFDSQLNFYTGALFTNNPNAKIKDKTKNPPSRTLAYEYGNRGSNCCP